MLYESTRILQRSPQVDGAIVELLRHARTMFRADVAELTLLPAREGEELLRSVVRGDAAAEAMSPMGTTLDDPLLRQALDARAPVLVAASDPAHSPRFRNAMVAPLVGERRVLGLLVVADRLSDISTFDTGDLRLFETLANHIGVSLENGRLEQSLHRLAELKDELHHQANHDSLTGLANRELFGKAVAARLEAAEPGGRVLALLFLDLDDFKLVNDTLGHPVGDELLRMVGDRIARIVRGEDVAARLGGDEFAVLLWDREDLAGARRLAERLRIALDDVFHIGSSVVSIHASVGLAAAASPSIPAEDLMRNADVAMYVAKANGKGRLVVFEPSMAAELVHRSRTSTDLRSAIVGGQLVLHYQPVFDIGSDRVVGAEALVRWNHPQRGLVGPLEFIELAEQSSLIIDLGAWVIHTAAAQLRAWADLGEPYDSWWMSVNVSPRQLERPEFVDEIARALEVAGVTPDRLALEMTESALIPSVDASVDRLHRLRRLGVMLMIDDFGTGYSSLGYLQRFPVGTLKIAREFVDVDAAKPGAWGLAAAVIAMSETLGLDVIAEGVETEEQLERLRDLGCRHAQGFLLARPAPATDIERRFGPPAEVAPPSMGYAPTHRPVLPTR
jgi:diguanylate cyclase (GGDEF)-like protein